MKAICPQLHIPKVLKFRLLTWRYFISSKLRMPLLHFPFFKLLLIYLKASKMKIARLSKGLCHWHFFGLSYSCYSPVLRCAKMPATGSGNLWGYSREMWSWGFTLPLTPQDRPCPWLLWGLWEKKNEQGGLERKRTGHCLPPKQLFFFTNDRTCRNICRQ